MRALRGLLTATDRGAPVALPCRTDLVTATAVRVRLPRDLGPLRGSFPAGADAKLAARFLKRFGRDLSLRLTVGTRDAWSGPVRVCTVEPCSEDTDVLRLTLAFAGPLPDEALERLDLVPPPARDAQPPGPAPRPPQAPEASAVARVAAPRTGDDERRMAPRVEIRIPAQILTAQGFVAAVVRNISRTGLRMVVKGRHVGCGDGADMAAVAAGVHTALKPRFTVQLHHRMLGSLLAREVQMTRLAIVPGGEGDLEFGGHFEEPLGAEETMVLGVPLPPMAASNEDWCPRADQPAPHRRTGSHEAPPSAPVEAGAEDALPCADGALRAPQTRAWQAYLRGRGTGHGRVVSCVADRVAPDGLRLRVGREHVHPSGPGAEGSVASYGLRFVEAFGNEVSVQVMDGEQHVWTGPLSVGAVELPGDARADLLVTLRFTGPLRARDLARLGLSLSAA